MGEAVTLVRQQAGCSVGDCGDGTSAADRLTGFALQ